MATIAIAAALGVCWSTFSMSGQNVAAESLKALRARADQGLAEAQFNLGIMYDGGQGVAQDYAEAVRWFRKAADQSLAAAQFNLGDKDVTSFLLVNRAGNSMESAISSRLATGKHVRKSADTAD